MGFLLIIVALITVAFFMGTRRHPALSLLGQGVLLVLTLAVGAGILFCIVYPIVSPRNGNGVLMLGAIPLFIIGLIPWGLLNAVQDTIRARRISSEEREEFIEGGMNAIDAELQAEMKDEGYVKGSMLSTADRMRQREEMKHNKFSLMLIKMLQSSNKKSQ